MGGGRPGWGTDATGAPAIPLGGRGAQAAGRGRRGGRGKGRRNGVTKGLAGEGVASGACGRQTAADDGWRLVPGKVWRLFSQVSGFCWPTGGLRRRSGFLAALAAEPALFQIRQGDFASVLIDGSGKHGAGGVFPRRRWSATLHPRPEGQPYGLLRPRRQPRYSPPGRTDGAFSPRPGPALLRDAAGKVLWAMSMPAGRVVIAGGNSRPPSRFAGGSLPGRRG